MALPLSPPCGFGWQYRDPVTRLRTVMSPHPRTLIIASLLLSFSVSACEKKKSQPTATGSSAAVTPVAPTASLAVWSPPKVCTTLQACQKRCEACATSCKPEDASACNEMGDLLLRDEMGQFDIAGAARAYERACEGGQMLACSALAIQVQDGRGVARDIPRAVSLYEKSCNGGIGVGCYNLGLLYLHGGGGTIDEARSRTYFQQAREKYEQQCDGGDLQWCMNLGVIYENGHGVPADPDRAKSIYEKACAKGHGDSCVNLALAKFAAGTLDAASELSVLEARCNTGTVLACGVLGQMYVSGGPGVPAKPELAMTLLERSCTGGSAHSCATLGAFHGLGKVVPVDLKAAARFSQRACELGYSASCTALGMEASNRSAWVEAQKYLQLGCWIGDGEACSNLALLVGEGKGSKPDAERALALTREACGMGQGPACMELLKRKEPIPLPDDRKQQLFEAACKRGFPEACAALGL